MAQSLEKTWALFRKVASGLLARSVKRALPPSYTPPGVKSLPDIDADNASYPAEPVVIQGLVSPESQGGVRAKEAYWTHCFSFAAWRRTGGLVIERQLIILRPVPLDAEFFEDFPKHTIHRVEVYLSNDETRAVFKKSVAVDVVDDELQSVSEELQKPVIKCTERFGDLTLDRSIEWFRGQTLWNGKKISISFPTDITGSLDEAIAAASFMWADQPAWSQRIEDCAVNELLEVRNDNWSGESEPELTADEFVSRMTLDSATVWPDGNFEFWYDDGDLFWGHSIKVSGNVSHGATGAGIEG
jgi:hypothetical protein